MLLRKLYYLLARNHSQWLSRNKLEKIQLQLLQHILQHAYETVPYYRNLFNRAHLKPADINSLADIKKIPISKKEDIRSLEMNQRLSKTFKRNDTVRLRTGGSTGKFIEIHINRACEDLRSASIFRTYFANGYRPLDRIGILQFHPLKRKTTNKLGLVRETEIPFTLPLNEQVELLSNQNLEVLIGYPSRIAAIARVIMKEKIRDIRPKLIVTNSETLQEADRKQIKKAFCLNPTNVYDSWELGNIAWECPQREGLHINADLLFVELIHDNKEVGKNESGEVVITDFFNRAMPLIRYAIGDIAEKTDKICSCGRGLPLLKKIIGRTTEVLIRADGSEIVPTAAITGQLEPYQELVEFQAIQKQKGELTVQVVAKNNLLDTITEEIRKKLIDTLGLDNVTITQVDSIKKTESGKMMTFISQIKHNEILS